MENKKAIVSIAIGDKYISTFKDICYESWDEYCDRYGYDLIIIASHLDTSKRAFDRSPSWQKLLILSQEWSNEYETIVWLDSDIIINNKFSYDISSGVPADKIGAVDAYSIPTKEIYKIALLEQYRVWRDNGIAFLDNDTPQKYYTNRGIECGSLNQVMQAGVFVCSPKHHREIFEKIYFSYEDSHGPEWNYEMPAMSYEVLSNNLIHWISPRFNFCVGDIAAAFYNGVEPSQYLKRIYDLSIFMHFAGCIDKMPIMKSLIK